MRVEQAVLRLKEVFLEMPGSQMTVQDAARLTGVDREVCDSLLAALEDVRFVRRRGDGVFVRRTAESPS